MLRTLSVIGAVLLGASVAYAAAPSLTNAQLNRGAQLFPKSNPPAKQLLHVDLLSSTDDVRFALTVLQGLVNRTQPRICITQNPEWHGAGFMPTWIENLKSKGYSFTEVSDPLSLVTTFRDTVKGAVIYESNLKETPDALHKLNPITLYCALNDAIPLTKELNAKLNLPVLLDTTGKYNNPTTAYKWAYTELWPKANHRLLAHTHPTHMVLRDYLVANKIMPFWVSNSMDKTGEETCLRMLDEAEPNAPVLGCWGGFGENPSGRYSEAILQRLCSQRGKLLLVTDGCFDLTVHSGFEFKPVKPATRRVRPALDPSKVYICFNFTDGDNLQYIQQYFGTKQWWGDPQRGKTPLGWSMSPDAAELMPDVLEYFLSSVTENDEFNAPTAGAGLVTPALYGKDLYANHEALYDEYISITAKLMQKAGFKCVHLGDTSSVPWTIGDFDRWARKAKGLRGIIGDYGGVTGVDREGAAVMLSNDVPVARAIVGSPDPGSIGNKDRTEAWVDAIHSVTPKHRPAFIHVSVINWFDSPTSITRAAEALGAEYVPVLPSELFDLMRESAKK